MSRATSRGTGPGGATPRRLAAVLAAAAAISGCSWGPKYRSTRPSETLEVESYTVSLPGGAAWSVTREREPAWRKISATRVDAPGERGAAVLVFERRGPEQLPTRDEQLAYARKDALRLLGDPDGVVTDISPTPDPRFGPSAFVVLARAEQSDASAGLLVKRTTFVGVLQFVPPEAPDRLCVVQLEGWLRGASAEEVAERWDALLRAIVLRRVDDAAIRAAAGPDYPKAFDPRLSHRSLTLPAGGLQLGWRRERWIAPGGSVGAAYIRVGVTDRFEVSLPGYFRVGFGDPEALVGPEAVIGGGISRVEKYGTNDIRLGVAVNAAARRRLGANVDVVAGGFLEAVEQHGLNGSAAAGVRWDPTVFGFVDLVGLGLEVGYASRDEGLPSRRLAWIGGRNTPLVTAHLLFVDLGLTGGLGWDGEDVGALVGFELVLTF